MFVVLVHLDSIKVRFSGQVTGCLGCRSQLQAKNISFMLVHGQVTIIFVVSVCLSICLSVCLCRVFLSRL